MLYLLMYLSVAFGMIIGIENFSDNKVTLKGRIMFTILWPFYGVILPIIFRGKQ